MYLGGLWNAINFIINFCMYTGFLPFGRTNGDTVLLPNLGSIPLEVPIIFFQSNETLFNVSYVRTEKILL